MSLIINEFIQNQLYKSQLNLLINLFFYSTYSKLIIFQVKYQSKDNQQRVLYKLDKYQYSQLDKVAFEMLLNHLQLIKSHFSQVSIHKKNIFLTKQYDYPQPLIQKLYVSFVQIQQLLRTKPHQDIVRRINMINNKNIEKYVMGFTYLLFLYQDNNKDQFKQSKQSKSLKQSKQLKQSRQQMINSQKSGFNNQTNKLIPRLYQYLALFRNQVWTQISNVTIELLFNFQNQIKPQYRCGFIQIFKLVKKYFLCSDEFFLTLLKSLNAYNHSPSSLHYNIQVLHELNSLVLSSTITLQYKGLNSIGSSKFKELINLMRHYFFGKLIHILYLASKSNKVVTYKLDMFFQQTKILLKNLFRTSPQECLTFSHQLCRYTDFQSSDQQVNNILMRIKQQSLKQISQKVILQHYSLVPLALCMLLPNGFQKTFIQMQSTIFIDPSTRIQKFHIHIILDWLWKSGLNSVDSTKNYLLGHSYPDIVRWCILANDKSLLMRIYIVQWVLYNTYQNQYLFRNVKYAFFFQFFQAIKNNNNDFNKIYTLTVTSMQMLNYFCFSSINLAQTLFLYILDKNIHMVQKSQSSLNSQQDYRISINRILKKAVSDGILKLNEIKEHMSYSIRNQLDIRIYQATYNQKDIQIQQSNQKKDQKQLNQTNLLDQRFKNRSLHQGKYYANPKLEFAFQLDQYDLEDHINQQDDEILYSSHQFIPSSNQLGETQQNQTENTYKRQNMISVQQLQKQARSAQKGKQLVQSHSINKIQELVDKKQGSINNKEIITDTLGIVLIHLQRQYIQQMCPYLQPIMQNPSIQSFTQVSKSLIKLLKQYKKSSETQMIQRFLQQTSKVIYLCFNLQFQSFSFSQRKDQYLPYFLLKTIHQYWKQSLTVYSVYVYKKLVKNLCRISQSCQFTFYYVFLDIFGKGLPHFKEMKTWLFQKQSQKFVIPILKRLLTDRFTIHIYQNAQCLKLVQ